jgi:hypothetical protein
MQCNTIQYNTIHQIYHLSAESNDCISIIHRHEVEVNE